MTPCFLARGLSTVDIPDSKRGSWNVERDFVDGIRTGKKPGLTDFETGVRYMQFTEAVSTALQTGQAVSIPNSA